MPPIQAISFDLWDTVFIDDSDEPKRAAAGRPPKPQARRDLMHQALEPIAPMDRDLVNCAYDTSDAAFRQIWHEQHVTWSVAERLRVTLDGLGQKLPDEVLAELVKKHERMELEHKPDLVPGVEKALSILTARYRLVVISDAIFSPGWALRELLDHYHLLQHFSGFVFSDEAGASKPAPELFHRAADLANCEVENLVHIGDREQNDIAGPKAVGARAVLLTAAVDRGSQKSQADAICKNYDQLPDILHSMER